jgi:uncharacterized protein (DUF983 family)
LGQIAPRPLGFPVPQEEPKDGWTDSAILGPPVAQEPQKTYFTVLSRAWRLRCPRCGQGRLFRNWIRMNPRCAACNLRYEREPGFFLGSIYINYGLTALLVTIFYFALYFSHATSPQAGLWIVTAFALVFPIWFFRYARSLWLGFDQYWDPLPEEPEEEDTQDLAGE